MEQKLKICSVCGVPSKLWRSTPKLCKPCAMKADAKDKPKETTVPRAAIKPVSDKRAQLNKAYTALRKVYIKQHPFCEAMVICDGLPTSDIHHKKGRGQYFLDDSTFLATCRNCHRWIEENVERAKELGFSENRLSK